MTTKTHNAEPTASSTPAPRRDITWGGFAALNPPKAVKKNVGRVCDEVGGRFSKASLRFLNKHGINWVYAPGMFPL